MKKILYVLFISIILTNFANAIEITSWKDNYPTGNATWIEVKDKPNNHEDWIGIYPRNSNNSWSNVIAWAWARDTSPTTVDPGDWYEFQLNDGAYDARFFLNNTYTVEDSIAFSVGEISEPTVSIDNDAVSPNENIHVSLSNLSGNQDWVGIYPKNASNSWGNVVTWKWADNTNITLSGVSAGEYEARLFFNNTYNLEAKTTFTVGSTVSSLVYPATHINSVKRYPASGLIDDYVVYFPDEHITPDMPVILFLEGGGAAPHIDDHKGIMKYLASRGYFVIGAESGNGYSNSEGLEAFNKAIDLAKEAHHLDISKLIIIGHSQGGGQAFYMMQEMLVQGYGSEGNAVVSLDGWFSMGMDKSDLNNLNTNAFILQMNGLIGVNQDPRINLTIWKLLTGSSSKVFLTLPYNDHHYSKGDLNTMLTQRIPLLNVLGAITNDIFTGNNNGHITILDDRQVSYSDIYNELREKNTYSAGCDGKKYNVREGILQYNNIDYCIPNEL